MKKRDPKDHMERYPFPIFDTSIRHEHEKDVGDPIDSSHYQKSFPLTRDLIERLINRLEEV